MGAGPGPPAGTRPGAGLATPPGPLRSGGTGRVGAALAPRCHLSPHPTPPRSRRGAGGRPGRLDSSGPPAPGPPRGAALSSRGPASPPLKPPRLLSLARPHPDFSLSPPAATARGSAYRFPAGVPSRAPRVRSVDRRWVSYRFYGPGSDGSSSQGFVQQQQPPPAFPTAPCAHRVVLSGVNFPRRKKCLSLATCVFKVTFV